MSGGKGTVSCTVSTDCLTCPLPQCKYDDLYQFHKEERDRKYDQIIFGYGSGLSVAQIAQAQRVSTRTVFRVLADRQAAPLSSPH